MAGMFSPTRSFGATMRSVASPVKEAPQHADLSITQASVHPQDWARRTVRDMDVAASSKASASVLRTETLRKREFQEHALRSTDSRVTLALQQRVDETRAAIAALEATLADTNAEIETLEASKRDVEANLQDNLERIKVPKQCLARRAARPHNERVLDDAEIELTAEVRQFESCIQRLQEQLRKMENDLRTLRAAKFKIEKNLKDKYEALRADEDCLQIRSP